MEIPPFTIIYRGPRSSGDEGEAAGGSAADVDPLRRIGKLSRKTAESLKALKPDLRRTLIDSSCELSYTPLDSAGVDFGEVVRTLRPVLEDLGRARKVATVAVWDLDAHVADLARVIKHMNGAQTAFTFLSLQAPLPSGLVARHDFFLDWVQSRPWRLKKEVIDEAERSFGDNLMSNDFYKHARVVHKTLGVDYTVGITRQMIAGRERGEFFWNYFAASSKPILLVSTYGLREYAREAGRPFEVAVAGLIVSQLLVETNKRVRYHEDTGCLFDFNASRDSIVTSLREAKIEPECLARIDVRYRKAAAALVEALRAYTPAEADAPEETDAPPDGQTFDDNYWLEQLTNLRKPKPEQPAKLKKAKKD